MPYPNIRAGQIITAAILNAGKPEIVTNSGGAQTNTTTTLANATGLSFPVEANAVYYVQARISYDSPANCDSKFAWTVPAGATMARNITTPALSATTNLDTNMAAIRRGAATQQVAGGNGGAGSTFVVHAEDIHLITGSTTGTAQLQFASNATTSAGTTTLNADSIIIYQRIG